MTRHRRHDPDEVERDTPWRAQDRDRPGESTSPPWERTAPPWELPGWDEAVPAQRRSRDDSAHPSGPLPQVNSGPLPRLPAETGPPTISGPLPAVPREPWTAGRGSYPAARHSGRHGGQDDTSYLRTGSRHGGDHDSGAYPAHGGGYDEPGYDERGSGDGGYGDSFPARGSHSRGGGGGYLPDDPLGGDYATGAGYDEDYHTGPGYPAEPDYPDEHGYAGGASYPGTDYPADPGYPGQDYARDDDYPGHDGYAGEPGYPAQDGYPAGPGDYLDDTGYQAADDYRDQPQAQPDRYARALRDDPDDHGYGDRGGWYGDVDEDQAWGDDEYDQGVLPGFSEDTGYRSARRPAGDRAPGGGRKPPPRRPRGGPPKKRKGPMRRAAPWIALTVLAVVIAVAGGGFFYVWHNYLHPPDYSGPGTGSVTVQIKSGETATQVGQVLVDKGVVASVRAFANAAKASGKGNALEPGYYRLHSHMAATLAFALLLKPSSRIVLHVLITEGMRLSEIIAKLGQATGNLKGYQQAIKDVSALGLPSYAKGNPEGYLFPATYTIQPGTQPIQVLRAMVLRFTHQEVQSVNLAAVAKHDQISEGDAIIVASLIQAEGKRPQDLPKIARVIYNRLNAKMALQLDTTVLYAMNSRAGDVSVAQTQSTKSRYNTYLHLGLPPGPIDSPGDAAIKAALHPAPTTDDWLYFLTVNPKTGLTKFTNSFTEFQQFQQELANYKATHH
jgi:peptidoglycan lytic transglycosylase G